MGAPTASEVAAPSPWAKWVYPALFLHLFISAGTYLCAKRAMLEIPPGTLLCIRLYMSAVVFGFVLWLTPGPKVPSREMWLPMLALGFLAGPINQGAFLWGLSLSTPAHGSLIYALSPAGVYLYMLLKREETFSTRRVVAIGIAFLGVLVLLLGRGLSFALGPLGGDFLILLAVGSWVFYSGHGRTIAQRHGPIRMTAWSMMAGGLWCVPLAPFVGTFEPLRNASTVAWACLGFIAVCTSVVAYLLWYFALTHFVPSKVAVFSNLQPVLTALLSWWLLGEALRWEMWVGGALVLLGVRFAQRGG